MQPEAPFSNAEEMQAAAARLDAAIELSALCMDLALAGKLQRAAASQDDAESLLADQAQAIPRQRFDL